MPNKSIPRLNLQSKKRFSQVESLTPRMLDPRALRNTCRPSRIIQENASRFIPDLSEDQRAPIQMQMNSSRPVQPRPHQSGIHMSVVSNPDISVEEYNSLRQMLN